MQRGRRERAVPSRARDLTQAPCRTRAVPVKSSARGGFTPAEPKMESRNEGHVEAKLLWSGLLGRESPQVDRQSPRGGDGVFSPAAGRERGFVDQRLDRFVVGLPAREPPHQLHQRSADGTIAAAVDRAFAAFAITGVNARTQSGVAGDLATILETRPVADFTRKDDPGQRTDATR